MAQNSFPEKSFSASFHFVAAILPTHVVPCELGVLPVEVQPHVRRQNLQSSAMFISFYLTAYNYDDL